MESPLGELPRQFEAISVDFCFPRVKITTHVWVAGQFATSFRPDFVDGRCQDNYWFPHRVAQIAIEARGGAQVSPSSIFSPLRCGPPHSRTAVSGVSAELSGVTHN